MIPLRDHNPTRTTPYVTYGLIGLNILVFLFQLGLDPRQTMVLFYRFGVVPAELVRLTDLGPANPLPLPLTLITSLFLHGGFLHLAGNMLYLWIFGDNIEALTGHIRFFFFYLICGLAASVTHIAFDPNSTVPMVGASGAISGVLGAYLIRFPKAKIHVLFVLFIFIRVIRIPAVVVLGFWFVMQLASGWGALQAESAGGVAWFAHIGGFIAGMMLIFFFEKKGRVRVY